MKLTKQEDTQDTELINKTAGALKAAALEKGISITADGRVGETDAAWLLYLQPVSLKSLRLAAQGPCFYYRTAGNGSRISYRFEDLAAWLELGRKEI
jgi:hypothetical protein